MLCYATLKRSVFDLQNKMLRDAAAAAVCVLYVEGYMSSLSYLNTNCVPANRSRCSKCWGRICSMSHHNSCLLEWIYISVYRNHTLFPLALSLQANIK